MYQCLQASNTGIDLVLCCGDFQSLRHDQDLQSLSCPVKYKSMGDFHRYYNGELKAPFLTIFIGGNHESTVLLRDLYYGGWVAPNIYYLGAAGVINVTRNGFKLRIAGVSGIDKPYHFQKGFMESYPYTFDDFKSLYHIRCFDVQRLNQITGKIDIMMSHEWPSIATSGNCA